MILELKHIQKRFGGVAALKDGNLQVRQGEVHLLMGENGAGKSTLMKIVAGLQPADSGEILWRGSKTSFSSPAAAATAGIAMVHQECLLASHLTVAENIYLGREPANAFGYVNRREIDRRARILLEEHHFPLQPDWKVGRLSLAQKQLVEISRAIAHRAELLIFDEPTSSLSENETREVFRIVSSLRSRGVGVIYITHRLEELRAVGDRVTILRDGETVHSCLLSELTTDELIRHMVGRSFTSAYQRVAETPGAEVLRVEHLTRQGVLNDISFSLRAGEVVGLGGLVGAGRTELCRAIFGIDPIDSGRILIDGKACSIRSPQDATAAGIALIPEDRQKLGLATGLSIRHNTTLSSLDKVSRFSFVSAGDERRVAAEAIQKLRIRSSGPEQIAGRLSGGNQQKVVISKWLAKGARIFLFDEPTRGIDVGAKVEVFEVISSLARNGAAILVVSSELPELLQVSDRILVMASGRIAGELPNRAATDPTKAATQEDIMRLAAPQEWAQ
ncbi:MAG TPA: sugar ABC transporter ATP-binding protein [Bryobacteraceae bacterium]|nr:sugar ABC transporter ATP-binding protein [Bryobacteraceae bacterium]